MNAPQNAIALPPDLLEQAARAADRRGIDLNAWVGECVRASLAAPPPTSLPEAPPASLDNDPLFTDVATFDGGPTDGAARHDDYLYGPVTGASHDALDKAA